MISHGCSPGRVRSRPRQAAVEGRQRSFAPAVVPVGLEKAGDDGLAIPAELGVQTPLDEGKVDRDQARIERAGDERDDDHRGEVPPRLTATAAGASPCGTPSVEGVPNR